MLSVVVKENLPPALVILLNGFPTFAWPLLSHSVIDPST